MQDWNASLGEAIAAIGRDGFPARLETALSSLMPFRICMVFSYEGSERPRPLHHNMPPEVARVVVEDYCRGPYLLDPLFAEVTAGRRSGMAGLRQLAPDGFFKSEYSQSHYSRTGIIDEIAVFAALSPSETAVASLARTREARPFGGRERAALAAVAPVVGALMTAHWGRQGEGAPGRASDPGRLEAITARIGGSLLTPREAEVVALILKGHSAAAIGARLAISEGTAKVHRKNAYRKLNISSQAELFSLFVAAL